MSRPASLTSGCRRKRSDDAQGFMHLGLIRSDARLGSDEGLESRDNRQVDRAIWCSGRDLNLLLKFRGVAQFRHKSALGCALRGRMQISHFAQIAQINAVSLSEFVRKCGAPRASLTRAREKGVSFTFPVMSVPVNSRGALTTRVRAHTHAHEEVGLVGLCNVSTRVTMRWPAAWRSGVVPYPRAHAYDGV